MNHMLWPFKAKQRRGVLRRAVFSDHQRKGLETAFAKQKRKFDNSDAPIQIKQGRFSTGELMGVPNDYLNMNFGVGSEQLSNYRNAMSNYPMHLSYNSLNDTASNNALKQHSTNMYLNSMSGKFIFTRFN